jgi:serine/threonine-protein kinase
MAGRVMTVGRYALRHEIASGGMAVVHLGRLLGPAGFSRTVAIKRLHPHLARNPEFVAMFLDEARLAARIRHPNVVSTLDVVATDGELFVVMEYVAGDSLARLLRAAADRNERAPLPVAASIMVNVLHGLHAAHEACDEQGHPLSLVHRDVSPHNVLVGTDGQAHLIDFGVAKATGRAQVTREGQLKGKLAYMAPEQLKGKKVDRRADVFGAGVIFWEMLTGERLFDGADEGEIYGKVLRGDVLRPSKIVPGLDRKMDAIVVRSLTRNPERRYESARVMALAIEESLPLATPSQVGQWVERLMGDVLSERRRQIAAIEAGAGSDEEGEEGTAIRLSRPPDPAVNIPTAPGGRVVFDEHSLTGTRPELLRLPTAEAMLTDTSLVASEPQPPVKASSRRGSLLGLAGAAIVLLAVAGGVALLRRDPPTKPPAAASAGNATLATPSAALTVPTVSIVSSTTSMPVAPASMSPGPASPPVVSPTDLPEATSAPAGRAAPPRRAAPASCNPPYTIGPDGYKKYKRECASL